jgi:cell division protein FtsL
METKTSYSKKAYEYLQQFRDYRAMGLLLFVIVVLLISWSGVKVIDTNYRLQQQIAQLQQQNKIQQLTNDNLQLTNNYYETNQYLELSARQDLGLAAPGETVVIIPTQVALAHTVNLPNNEAAETRNTEAKEPLYQRNFQAWLNFLFHRQAATD